VAVVFAIAVSGVIAGIVAIERLIHHNPPENLVPLAAAGAIGFVGNAVASRVRSRAGRELNSRALIADGHHARMDAAVSAGVVLSAVGVGLGFRSQIPSLVSASPL
jgi:divalent metal cation (Fe/Co/Zn/Cd) transporter